MNPNRKEAACPPVIGSPVAVQKREVYPFEPASLHFGEASDVPGKPGFGVFVSKAILLTVSGDSVAVLCHTPQGVTQQDSNPLRELVSGGVIPGKNSASPRAPGEENALTHEKSIGHERREWEKQEKAG